jgi:hypothetical protein
MYVLIYHSTVIVCCLASISLNFGELRFNKINKRYKQHFVTWSLYLVTHSWH